MMELTKERLMALSNRKNVGAICSDEIAEMARQLLAGLEQEPVAYIDPFTFKNFATYRAGETDNKRMGREWVWANPYAGLIPLYAAPQLKQPAVVPECLEKLRSLVADKRALPRRKEWISGQQYSYVLLENVEGLVEEACRAAMLQGAEPVQGWIPCSERMPEEVGRYWCYVEEQNSLGKSHYQWNCSWNGDRWWVESENGGRVTHWMPLPAAPQQE